MTDKTLNRLIQRFHNLAHALGEEAFATKTSIVFYSGPPHDLVNAVGLDRDLIHNYNNYRSEKSATIFDATRINDTMLGQMLFKSDSQNIYSVMQSVYGKKGRFYADQINIEFSRLFTSHAEGKVFTAVCGASRDRIFCTTELPAIVTNSKVTHVNGIDADIIREQFHKNAERAFRRVCQSEQSLAFGVAQNLGTKEVFVDYAERRDFRRADYTLLRDEHGEIIAGQTTERYASEMREKFAEEKLAAMKERQHLGLNRPWRRQILQGTKAGPK